MGVTVKAGRTAEQCAALEMAYHCRRAAAGVAERGAFTLAQTYLRDASRRLKAVQVSSPSASAAQAWAITQLFVREADHPSNALDVPRRVRSLRKAVKVIEAKRGEFQDKPCPVTLTLDGSSSSGSSGTASGTSFSFSHGTARRTAQWALGVSRFAVQETDALSRLAEIHEDLTERQDGDGGGNGGGNGGGSEAMVMQQCRLGYHQGVLWKLGKRWHSWKNRWYVVNPLNPLNPLNP